MEKVKKKGTIVQSGMKRKVVSHGPATLTISLPSVWVKRHRIRKGMELNLSIKDEKLVIAPQKLSEFENITLNIDGLDRTFAKLCIRSAYRKGYDNLKIAYRQPKIVHYRTGAFIDVGTIAKQEARQLIGFEITDLKPGLIEFSNLTQERNEEFGLIMKKSMLHLRLFLETIVLAVQKGEQISLEELEEKHSHTEKLNNYCLRLLNKTETLPPREERILYHIISSLDAVNNILKWFYRDGVIRHKPLSKKGVGYLADVLEYVDRFIHIYLHFDRKRLSALGKLRKNLRDDLAKLANKLSGPELLLLAELKAIVEIIYLLAVTLMELYPKE